MTRQQPVPLTPFERKARILGWFLMISGFAGFFGCALCSFWLTQRTPPYIELPLGDISSIATDSRGRIYCASQAYGRIQQYDSSGRFIRGWWIDASGGSFALTIDKSDLIHVGTARTDLHLVYNTSGQLISTEPSDTFYDALDRSHPLIWYTNNGTTYKAVTPNLYPRVARVTKSGEQTTIVAFPIYLWPVSGPLQGWLRVVAGIVILNTVYKRWNPKKQKT